MTLTALIGHLYWLSEWSGRTAGYGDARATAPREEHEGRLDGPTWLFLGLRHAAKAPSAADTVARWLDPWRAPWAPATGVRGVDVVHATPRDEAGLHSAASPAGAYYPAKDRIYLRPGLDPVLEQQILTHELVHRLQHQVGPRLALWWDQIDPAVPAPGLYAASHPREHQAEAGALGWSWLVWCAHAPRGAIGALATLEEDVPGVHAWADLWVRLSADTPPTSPGCIEVLRAGIAPDLARQTQDVADEIGRFDRTALHATLLGRHLRGTLTVRIPTDDLWRWALDTWGSPPPRRDTAPAPP